MLALRRVLTPLRSALRVRAPAAAPRQMAFLALPAPASRGSPAALRRACARAAASPRRRPHPACRTRSTRVHDDDDDTAAAAAGAAAAASPLLAPRADEPCGSAGASAPLSYDNCAAAPAAARSGARELERVQEESEDESKDEEDRKREEEQDQEKEELGEERDQEEEERMRPVVQPHVLYIVSTPIGNQGDITARARAVLGAVDVIAAEDTRRARTLLARLRARPARPPSPSLSSPFSGTTPPSAAPGPAQTLLSFHAHNWRARAPALVDRLRRGDSVALVCDAGTPCVSDPGAELAAAAVAEGIRVVPVPGPCAALAALVCAALPPGVDFVVVGFIPRSGTARKSALARIATSYKDAAVVLYEAPHRIRETLAELATLENPEERSGVSAIRSVCIGREVTKKYEQFLRFDTSTEAARFYPDDEGRGRDSDTFGRPAPRGEFTVVLGPASRSAPSADASEEEREQVEFDNAACDMRELVKRLVVAGVPTSTVSKSVSSASSLSRRLVYAYAMQIKKSLDAPT